MNNKDHLRNRYKLYLIDDNKYSYKPIKYEDNTFSVSYIPSFIFGTLILYTSFYGVVYTGLLAITYIL